MRAGVLLYLLLLIFWESSGVAQNKKVAEKPKTPPALNSIIQKTMEFHPFLNATQEEILGVKGELLSAQGTFDPVLRGEVNSYPSAYYTGTYSSVFAEQPLEWMGSKVFAGYRKGGGTFPIYENYYETDDQGEARVGFEIPVLRDRAIDRRRASIQRAVMQIEGAELTFEQRKIELVRLASNSFWDWVAAQQKYKAYSDLLAVAEERDKQLAQRVAAGDFAEFDRVDNQRQVLQRKAQLVSAERALKKAEYDLSLFCWKSDGLPDDSCLKHTVKEIILPPMVSSVELELSRGTATKSRPDILRLDNQIKQQNVEKKLAQNQILPRLDVKAYGAKDYGDDGDGSDQAEVKVGVMIEIPLETRVQRGKLNTISAKERELTFQKQLAEQKIATEVLDAYNALTLAMNRIEIVKEEVRVAKELAAGERLKFEQGDSNLIFVNLREQTTTDATVREIDSLADAWKAYAGYRAAVGEY